jgi:hypothetical protein
VDKDYWLVCEVGLSMRTDVFGCARGQPLSQPGDRARPVGDDPEGDIDSAAGVFRRVVRAAPEPGGTPVPGHDHAPEKARQARVFREADDDVEVPDTPAPAQIMLGAALREGDNAQPVLPASKVWVAGEEGFELSFCGAPQPSEIRLVKAFVGTRHIAASAFMSGMPDHHVTVASSITECALRWRCADALLRIILAGTCRSYRMRE